MATTEELLFVIRLQDSATSVMAGFSRTVTQTASAAKTAKGNLNELGAAITGTAVAFGALAAGNKIIKDTVGVFREYELGMANVQKVTGIGGDAVKDFSTKFDDLARRIPLSVDELQKIAITAGQLGVQGTENVLAITEAMAKLGTTTNITGEKGTLAMTQLLNVMHEAPTEAGRLGSQIVSLDNVTAAAGMSILGMAKEIGLATTFFDIGSTKAVAIGATLAGLGVRSERAGTAVGRVFTALDQATRGTLPKGLTDLERLFGESATQLRAMEQADPTAFFEKFIKALGDTKISQSNFYTLLKDMGLQQRETAASILPLADNYQKLASNIQRATVEAKYQTAQTREFDIFLGTLDSKIKLLNNTWGLFEKNLGGVVAAPAKQSVDTLRTSIDALNTAFTALPPQWQSFISSGLIAVTSVVAVTTAVRALASVLELLGVAVLTNPFTLLAGGAALAVAAFVSFNTTTQQTLELTQDETTRLAELTSGTKDADVAMQGLTKAQAENMQLALTLKIQDTNDKLAELRNRLGWGVDGWTGLYHAVENYKTLEAWMEINRLNVQLSQGGQVDIPRYRDALINMVQTGTPELRKQALEMLNIIQQINSATISVQNLQAAEQTLLTVAQSDGRTHGDGHGSPGYYTPPAKPAATRFAGDDPKVKKARGGGSDRAQEITDFLRDEQVKAAGYDAETAALNTSTEAYKNQQKVARDNEEINRILDRGQKLKIANINEITAAYRRSLEARDAAVDRRAATDDAAEIQKKIDAMKAEDAALAKGKKAYEDYKLAAKIDPEIEAFTKKLEALGMEKSAVEALAAAYKKASYDHVAAVDQAAKDAEVQKQSAEMAKSLASDFSKAFDDVITKGTSFKSTVDNLFKSILKTLMDDLVKKPMESAITNFFEGILTPGSQDKKSATAGGGSASLLGQLFGALTGNKGSGNTAGGSSNSGGGASNDNSLLGLAKSGASALSSLFSSSGSGAASSSDWTGGASASGVGSMFSGDSIGGGVENGVYHQGGLVGRPPQMRSGVDPAAWAGAPRYHSGLGNDEFAAILQRGERVMTASQNQRMTATVQGLSNQMSMVAQRAGQSGHTINFNVSTPDADSFKRSQGQLYSKAASALNSASTRAR